MRFRKLFTPEDAPVTQCSEPFENEMLYNEAYMVRRRRRYAARGFDPMCCGYRATHEINGRPLCRRHAADEALRILEESVK